MKLLQARSAQSSVSRILSATSATLMEEYSFVASDHAGELAEILLTLVKLSLRGSAAPPLWTHPRVDVTDRVRHYIAEHLRDPDLSITSIAEALGKSTRALQRATQRSQTWIRGLIWQERLERARGDLLDPERRGESISQIARSWGFRSVAHFSRAFRHRYGASPSQARRGIVAGKADNRKPSIRR